MSLFRVIFASASAVSALAAGLLVSDTAEAGCYYSDCYTNTYVHYNQPVYHSPVITQYYNAPVVHRHVSVVPRVSYQSVSHVKTFTVMKPVTRIVPVKTYKYVTSYKPVHVKKVVTHVRPVTTWTRKVSYHY